MAPDLARIVVGKRGAVAMRMDLVVRFHYGSIVPWVQRIEGGIQATAGPDRLRLLSPVETRGENLKTVAEFVVREGERVPSHQEAPLRIDAEEAVESTTRYWKDWSDACAYRGPHEHVLQGRYEEAQALFERLIALCNDVGLVSEEYDRVARRLVGNVPQAFTHVCLVNTALDLSKGGGPAHDRTST